MENEVMVKEQGMLDYAGEMETEKAMYCSFVADTPEKKMQLVNAMNNPDFNVSDCINQVILLRDVFVQTVMCRNEETGEENPAPRVVLIDKDGKAYHAVSVGIFSSLKNILFAFGQPSEWDAPIPVKIEQIQRGKNRMYTLKVVRK